MRSRARSQVAFVEVDADGVASGFGGGGEGGAADRRMGRGRGRGAIGGGWWLAVGVAPQSVQPRVVVSLCADESCPAVVNCRVRWPTRPSAGSCPWLRVCRDVVDVLRLVE